MHPAPSVIVFTVLSGLGFGLLAWLGLGYPNVTGWVAFAFFFIGYALATIGLLASAFHLGNPTKAIYAFSQWRTSWLSREGILSIVTLLVFAPYALMIVFFNTHVPFIGIIGAILALATIFTTSMIYTQLKTIPRWNMWLNPVLFMLYAVAGGALLATQVKIAGGLIAIVTVMQIVTWIVADRRVANSATNLGSATGLEFLGQVRMMESSHTARNYVLDEMVYKIARKHADNLRIITAISIGVLPAMLLITTPAGHFVAFVALAVHIMGVAIGRWLFFAEAEHVVGTYYTREQT